jgi:DNA polymerase III subunit beta
MRFTVSSSELLKHLQVANGAIGSNPVLPILEDFLFHLSGDKLFITASDLETSVTTSMDAEYDGKKSSIAIPAKILVETLKGLPSQPISFHVHEDNNGIELTSSYGRYKLTGEAGEDYPTLPDFDDLTESLSIPANILANGIAKTMFATSNDDLRPAMTGVYFDMDGTVLNFVATDAHKLVQFAYADASNENNYASFIIPKKALNLLKNVLRDGSTVEIRYNNSTAYFSFDDVRISCRLIEQKYPDYNAVIPKENPNVMNVQRVDLLNSIKRIAIYSNKSTNQIVMNVSDGGLTISAQDLDFSNEATEQIPCSYNGEPLQIAFNAKFLQEMLAALDSEEITLSMSTPSRAGILKPVDGDENIDITMLVMPIMVGY